RWPVSAGAGSAGRDCDAARDRVNRGGHINGRADSREADCDQTPWLAALRRAAGSGSGGAGGAARPGARAGAWAAGAGGGGRARGRGTPPAPILFAHGQIFSRPAFRDSRLLINLHAAGLDPADHVGQAVDKFLGLRDRQLGPNPADGPPAAPEDDQFDALPGAVFVQEGPADLEGSPETVADGAAIDPLLHRRLSCLKRSVPTSGSF